MIRTQIRLTEEQARGLRRLAAEKRSSLAMLIRQSVELYLGQEKSRNDRRQRVQRALRAAGLFASGSSKAGIKHDRYLARAFG